MVNENRYRREKIVYQALDKTAPIGDLVTSMGLKVSEFMDVAHWASNRQIQIGVRGFATKRYTTLEKILKRRSSNGSLRRMKYEDYYVYAKPIKTRGLIDDSKIYHGLFCTELLIRLLTAKEGYPLPESIFRGYRRVPEFGILYEKILLLAEASTKNDTIQRLRGKLFGYDQAVNEIERDFETKCIVVFILDVPRDTVKKVVEKYQPQGQYYFCDYETFKGVRMGEALISQIYFYTDGKEYSLTND